MLKKVCCLFSLVLSTALIVVLLRVTLQVLWCGRVILVEPHTRILHEEILMLVALIALNLVSITALWRFKEAETRPSSEPAGSS